MLGVGFGCFEETLERFGGRVSELHVLHRDSVPERGVVVFLFRGA
jgi:hypothetical protein